MMDRLQKISILCGAWFIVQLQGVATEFWRCIVQMLTCCESWFMHCQCSAVGLPLDKDGVSDWPLCTSWVCSYEILGSHTGAAESTSLLGCDAVLFGASGYSGRRVFIFKGHWVSSFNESCCLTLKEKELHFSGASVPSCAMT